MSQGFRHQGAADSCVFKRPSMTHGNKKDKNQEDRSNSQTNRNSGDPGNQINKS